MRMVLRLDVSATNHLCDGVDIRTVQSQLGHWDIQSTMVYLKGDSPLDPLRM